MIHPKINMHDRGAPEIMPTRSLLSIGRRPPTDGREAGKPVDIAQRKKRDTRRASRPYTAYADKLEVTTTEETAAHDVFP